jgi:hypothetical protein
MPTFRVRPHPVEAVQYQGQFTPEIRNFLGNIPHKFDNNCGIYIASLCGVVLVKPGTWMAKCPPLWDYLEFYLDKEFHKVYEAVTEDVVT